VKRGAWLVALVAGACASSATPDRAELAAALSAFDGTAVAPLDLAHIACRPITEEPTEFACRWRRRGDGQWQDWQSYLALSADGWQLIDAPSRRP
jgi:hypothetical protein